MVQVVSPDFKPQYCKKKKKKFSVEAAIFWGNLFVAIDN
jgi:hypothetical protein